MRDRIRLEEKKNGPECVWKARGESCSLFSLHRGKCSEWLQDLKVVPLKGQSGATRQNVDWEARGQQKELGRDTYISWSVAIWYKVYIIHSLKYDVCRPKLDC